MAKMMSKSEIEEHLDYASSYGTLDENSPNGTPCEHGGNPMCDKRRATIVAYKRVLGLLPKDYRTP